MSIVPLHPVVRLSQEEFKDLSRNVMRHVFDIHNEYGRFFCERIYKEELACRHPEVELEFPVTATHGSFSKTYFMDALVAHGGAFEFKAADSIVARHRGQRYNYLLLLNLAHGKLINLRASSVQHEFVNATLRSEDRHDFAVVCDRWHCIRKEADFVRELLVALLKDWGAGLELGMYEAALVHFLGGEEKVIREITVNGQRGVLGHQRVRLASDDIAFRLTAFDGEAGHFEEHARRFLRHVELRTILWINLTLTQITFTSIEKK